MARTPERVAAFHDGIFRPLQALAARRVRGHARRLTRRDRCDADWRAGTSATTTSGSGPQEHGVDADDGRRRTCRSRPSSTACSTSARRSSTCDSSSTPSHGRGTRRSGCSRSSTARTRRAAGLVLHRPPPETRQVRPRHGLAGALRRARTRTVDAAGGISCIVANVPRSTPEQPGAAAPRRRGHAVPRVRPRAPRGAGHERAGTAPRWASRRTTSPRPSRRSWRTGPGSRRSWRRVSRHHDTRRADAGRPVRHAWLPAEASTSGSRYLASFGGYGDFDLSIHGPEPVDLDEAMRAADAIRLLPTIEGTFWPASFAHLMGGYDAGYYGYLWSLVYGDDLWSRFAEQGVTSPTVGAGLPARDPRARLEPRRGGARRGLPRPALERRGVPASGPASSGHSPDRRAARMGGDATRPERPRPGAHRARARRGVCASWPRPGMEIRGAGDAPAAARGRSADRRSPAIASASRATSSSVPSPLRRGASCSTTATASRTPTSVATGSTSCPARADSRSSTIGRARFGWPTRPTSSSTSALGDGLSHIPYLATAFSTNADIEAQVSDAWRLYMILTNTRKPVVSGAFTEHGVPRMAAMMELFRRDRADLVARPMSIFTITATGNFRYSEDCCQNLIDCVEAGIPVEIVPVTLMGLIAPVTLVGATVFHTVDVLAGITMAQVVRPGRTGPLRRSSGHVPHEGGLLAHGGHRGAPPRRRLRRRGQAPRPALPVVHGALRWQDRRCPGRGRDVRVRAARRAGRRELHLGAGHARLPARLQPAQARARRRAGRPGTPLPA